MAVYFVERATASPVIKVSIFRIRPFLVENLVLAVAMMVYLPVFFFASEYAQVALGKSASEAGLFILFFFLGFVVAAQIGGRILDSRGAKLAVVAGCALAAVGFELWARKVTQLSFGSQRLYIILAGAGMGLMLGPASTDAVNRASKFAYGEAAGITYTVRNFAGSLGLAILGTVLVSELRSRMTTSLIAHGLPRRAAAALASASSQSHGGAAGAGSIPHFVRLDFAYATGTVFHVMAAIMAVGALVALVGLPGGLQQETDEAPEAERPHPGDTVATVAPAG